MESFLQFIQSKEFGVLGFCFFLYYLAFWWPKRSKTTGDGKCPPPPEVSGAWPIIGHLHLTMGGSQPPHVTLAAMADRYGPAFIFRLGQYPALVVSDRELAKELYTVKDLTALTRPKAIIGEHLGYNNAMMGFSQYGAYWREMRKVVSMELLSARRLELLKDIRVVETQTSVKELYKIWDEKRKDSSSGFVLVEMHQWFGNVTLNVILRMVVGKRYYGLVDPKDEKEAKRCQEVLRELFRYIGLYLVSDLIPLVRWMDLGGYEKKMIETSKDMDQMAAQWLKEHRQKKESGGKAKGENQDFMDVMISLMDEAVNDAGYDRDTIIKAICMNMIAAGSDTTTATLIWALTLVMNNPQVLRKAQEELDSKVGKDRLLEESDITNLVYLQAIVLETLRLYPAGALGGIREFTEDCTIGGYHIPKGTRLITNLWKLHRDPKVFYEPLKFMPERFLTTHKDMDVKGHHFELIPFGSGRRICPGMTFALQILPLVLAAVLHAFDFSKPNDKPIDMTETDGLINHKATPLRLLVAPRLPASLYN